MADSCGLGGGGEQIRIRRGSLNALEQIRPSRFWPRWLGQEMPSADTLGRVGALMNVDDVRALFQQVYSRLKRMKAIQPPDYGLMLAAVDMGHNRGTIENQGFNELANRWHADHVYRHYPAALLIFLLFALLCLNVFQAFHHRHLKPAVRQAASMLHIAQLIAPGLYATIVPGPARASP